MRFALRFVPLMFTLRPVKILRSASLACALLAAPGGCGGAYVAVQGGYQEWPDTSNSDEIEGGSEGSWTAGAAAGYRFQFDGWHMDLEGQLQHWQNDVHGRNDRPEHLSADGEEIDVTALLVNVWPAYELGKGWSVYAGGGFGGARVDTFGEDDYAPAGQVGLGLAYDIGQVTIDGSVRYFAVGDTDHAGATAEYDSWGWLLKLIWRF